MNRLLPLLGFFAALVLVSCGGGGGEGDSSGGGGDLSQDSCGTLGLKIYSGSVCTPASASPVVSFNADLIDGRRAFCTGMLITPNTVLTAGHCLPERGALVETVAVLVGGQTVFADGYAVHPGYSERPDLQAIFYDVGLLRLETSVGIAPLPLLTSSASAPGDVIDIFGYGLNEAGDLGTLRSGQMELRDVSPTHLFAPFGNDGSNTCLGDSGGPALRRSADGSVGIVGITSTGDSENLCERGDTSVFVNVQDPSVLSFIDTVASDFRTN